MSLRDVLGKALAWPACALAAAFAFAVGPAALAQEPTCNDTCYYAAPTGTGTTCSYASPCSIVSGLAKIASLLPTLDTDMHLYLRGGTYALAAPIQLGPQHSPSGAHRLFIEAHPNESPILSGGTAVAGWTVWDAPNNIQVADVPNDSASRQFYVNGLRAQRARGYENQAFQTTATGFSLVGLPATGWFRETDLETVFLAHWKSIRCPVTDVAAGSGTTLVDITSVCRGFTTPTQYYDPGVPDWLENDRTLIDVPGEWYLDRQGTTYDHLYYKPRAGEVMTSAQAVLPRIETLVRMGGGSSPTSNITLKGITFAHTAWNFADSALGYVGGQAGIVMCTGGYPCPPGAKPVAALSLDDASSVRVERCVFEHLGGSGISVSGRSALNQIEGNVFRDIASVGVLIGDVAIGAAPGVGEMTGNVVRNNYITETGRDYYDAVGLFVGYARNTQVAHNELRNLPYTGMSVGWGWGDPSTNDWAHTNSITGNLGANVLQRLFDGGQVYTLGVQSNSSITGNYFHNSVGVSGGIYLDNGTQHYAVQSNVVTSADAWTQLQSWVGDHFACDNTVQSNFADNGTVSMIGSACAGQGQTPNAVSGNTSFDPGTWGLPSSWFPALWNTLGAAGLEPAYADVRGGSTRVEAEDFNTDYTVPSSGHYDTTAGNSYGFYRTASVNADVNFCTTCTNDHMVVGSGTEWLRYYVDIPEGGRYTFKFRVLTNAASSIQLDVGGYPAGTATVPDTLGAWSDVTLTDVRLPKGPLSLRLTLGGLMQLDNFSYSRVAGPCEPGASPTSTLTADFDGLTGIETARIFQSVGCWEVSPDPNSRGRVWLSGWGSGDLHAGDFNGDGKDDVLVIVNFGTYPWHLALSTGFRFEKRENALVGWGSGNQTVVGDFDGDGKDDAVVMFYDTPSSVWRWHLAQSTGTAFTQYPNAQVGYGNGTGACVKDYDADGKDEIVVSWTPNICADLNPTTHTFTMTTPCAATCP
jgi:hypothetical protein